MFKNLLKRLSPGKPEAPEGPVVEAAEPPAPVVADVAGADALITEGNACEDAGELDRAEALYRAAVAKAPGHARAHLNLGIVLAARDDVDGAAAAYEQVLAIDPRHPHGNYNYARLLLLRGELARAETLIAQALQAKPDFHQALILQSSMLESQGKTGPAIESLQAALALNPAEPGAWFNLALMLQKARRPDDADVAVRRALEGEPDNAAGLELSMRIWRDLGFADEALVPLRKIIEQHPTSWPHRSFELMLMSWVDGIPADAQYRRHVEFGRDMEAAVPVRFTRYRESADPHRRLRVGYLSCDLRLHPVSFFLAPVLESHDRSQVEVFCYSLWPAEDADSMTERLRKATDQWRDVATLSDTALADAIHDDGIDVLVDLMGHTGQPRLEIFCQRPAPVQVGWIGYLNTTGLTRMDFRLCDVRTDPPAMAQHLHTERLVAMPESQWCYVMPDGGAVDPVAPFERNGHITFGSFNSAIKITSAACRCWAQILVRLPGSRLLIGDIKSQRKRAAILHDMASQGVTEDRIEFLPRVPLQQYLATYNRVDISLDTFPYGGGTTTFDSLWMGAPVVATVGEMPVSRSAASILSYLGMDEWVAPSAGDLVDVAVARASDRESLLAARRTLRARMAASPLTDIVRFTRDLETAYRDMWRAKSA